MTDAQRARLRSAFTHRLIDAGAPQPDVLAGELVTIAEQHGWRLVTVDPPTAGPPGDYQAGAEAARAALAREEPEP